MRDHANDEAFGSIWASHSSGQYVVHLRVSGAAGGADARRLSGSLGSLLGGKLVVDVGGLGRRQLQEKFRLVEATVRSRLSLIRAAYIVGMDEHRGKIAIVVPPGMGQDIGALVDGDSYVTEEVLEVPKVQNAPSASSQYLTNGTWQTRCTVGFAVRRNSDNWPGVVTNGHCSRATWAPSWTGRANGQTYWQGEQPTCGPAADSQIHPITGTVASPGSIWEVAGGLYENQPTMRQGAFTSNTSTVVANPVGVLIASRPVNGTGVSDTCPFMYNIVSFDTSNTLTSGTWSQPGDSGSPVLPLYANLWFLGGLHSASGNQGLNGASSRVSWIGNIPRAGWRVCTVSIPC